MKKLFSPWWLLLLAEAGAVALALVYANVWSLPLHGNGDKLGQLGDFFGGLLNPLVSLLTLIVAISVWQLQKKEVEETRKALEEQAKTAEQQRQEQRFFDLLNVYQRTTDSIYHATDVSRMPQETRTLLTATGKYGVSLWLRDAPSLLQFAIYSDRQFDANGLSKKWLSRDPSGSFDHYFRVVFRILSEAEALLTDQHFRYIKLFRAQLSRSELIILAYNLWLDDEGKKMIPLAEKYGLLKHLPKGHLRTTLEQELPALVFGRTRAAELAATSPAPSIEEAT